MYDCDGDEIDLVELEETLAESDVTFIPLIRTWFFKRKEQIYQTHIQNYDFSDNINSNNKIIQNA